MTLYLPSTPLNVLVSVALAVHQRQSMPETHSALWLIDQANTRANPYYESLLAWEDSPFDSVQILPGLIKNGLGRGKLKERQANFRQIDRWLSEWQQENTLPDVVATGSDRRVEFQYVMHRLQQLGHSAQGWYLDDGLYSYAGRPHHWFKDGVNTLLKKLVYGFWCQEPQTVGASSWIDQAWLFRPEQAVPVLKTKHAFVLSEDFFQTKFVRQLCASVAVLSGLRTDSLSQVQTLVLVPHPNNQKKMHRYKQKVLALVRQLTAAGQTVAVKYHPRQKGRDALGLGQNSNVLVLPSTLAFEMILPSLPNQTQIIGDVGTTLLTAKWLRPDSRPMAILNSEDPFAKRFIPLMKAMSVKVVSSVEDIRLA